MRIQELDPITVQQVDPFDNDSSTATTIALMTQYARAAAAQPPVIDATRRALAGIPGDAPAWRIAQSVFDWIRRNIQFRTDEELLARRGLATDQEFLIPPYLLLQFRAGDCDDFSMLACSMLMAAGISCSFVTIAADPDAPYRWSHVYSVAVLEDGRRYPIDTAAAAQGRGQGPGWELPQPYRRQEWMVS